MKTIEWTTSKQMLIQDTLDIVKMIKLQVDTCIDNPTACRRVLMVVAITIPNAPHFMFAYVATHTGFFHIELPHQQTRFCWNASLGDVDDDDDWLGGWRKGSNLEDNVIPSRRRKNHRSKERIPTSLDRLFIYLSEAFHFSSIPDFSSIE